MHVDNLGPCSSTEPKKREVSEQERDDQTAVQSVRLIRTAQCIDARADLAMCWSGGRHRARC